MSDLREFLNPLYERYHSPSFLSSDPLEFAHRFSDPWDQEAVALIGALLAYGNVKQIRRSVEDVLARIQRRAASPAEFVRQIAGEPALSSTPASAPASKAEWGAEFSGFVHRFNVGADIALLFRLLGRSWARYGSLGAHFLTYLDPGDATIAPALDRLIADWREWAGPEAQATSFSYLLNSPKDGSCCKRWCMFLRWMGRTDRLDLGLWTAASALAKTFPAGRELRPDQLVIPLDTHTGRISQYLGLTRRKSLNWRAAVEVTTALKACNPTDPTRYDFALSRLGILDLCQRTFREKICLKCDLLRVCRYAKRRSASLRKASVAAHPTQGITPDINRRANDRPGRPRNRPLR